MTGRGAPGSGTGARSARSGDPAERHGTSVRWSNAGLSNIGENVRMSAMPDHAAEPRLAVDALAALAVIAEPNRARIVEILRHGEHCVCDVSAILGLSTALVSHHLRALREVGLVNERRVGRWVYYALDLPRIEVIRTEATALLSPEPSATATCRLSDCGPRGARPSGPADRSDLTVLVEGRA